LINALTGIKSRLASDARCIAISQRCAIKSK